MPKDLKPQQNEIARRMPNTPVAVPHEIAAAVDIGNRVVRFVYRGRFDVADQTLDVPAGLVKLLAGELITAEGRAEFGA